MKLYLNLLKALLNRANYDRYYNDVSFEFLEKNHPEIHRLVQTIPLVHKGGKVDYSLDDLEVAFFGAYPKADQGLYAHLFGELRQCQADDFVVKEALEKMRQRELSLRLAREALLVAEGMAEIDRLRGMFENIDDEPVEEEEEFHTKTIDEILHERENVPGLRWRLASLNGALGSLRKGNFGFLFARPETGKTTFLASEVTHMAAQLGPDQGPILWINNEQEGDDVKTYMVRAALGLTEPELYDIMRSGKRLEDEYHKIVRDKLILKDEGGISKHKIERLCKQLKPSLIIIDQIDHIKGFDADRNDLVLQSIYVWARELAKKYCPVIAVCQAGASGEGKKWLTMNDVDNSKTGKQGAADWILGIGKTEELGTELLRHLNLSKNKLPGDKDTDPTRRHDKWSVLIKPEIARYVDFHEG